MLRGKHRSRVLVNGVLNKIFGYMREVVTGGWRNEELHDLKAYYSPRNIRMISSKAPCA
jgi:hypothetical protein